jgi:tight adherence protein C
MSEAYLALALFATFCAVALSSSVVLVSRAQHRRAARALELQLGNVNVNVDLKKRELNRSFAQRILLPLLERIGVFGRRFTSEDMREKLTHQLVLAGSPRGWDADRIIAVKLLVGIVVPALYLTSMVTSGNVKPIGLIGVALVAYIGWLGPFSLLSARASRRQEDIRRELPDTIDLLTISVEAGLGFDAAIGQCIRNMKGTLSDELARTMQEMQLGVSRSQAFRNLDARTEVEELKSFILAMIQADQFGISVARVLRAQTKQLRVRRRQRAEEKAMKLPIKVIFPLILCIMPSLFVVIIGPGVIRIVDNLFSAF